jgi:hypothetical protein
LEFHWAAFEEGQGIPLFAPEIGSHLMKRDRPTGTIVRDFLPAPELTKNIISFSLSPTFKFIRGSL